MRKPFCIKHRDYQITHNPNGNLSCYYLPGSLLEWCHAGGTVAEIKAEIARRREMLDELEMIVEVMGDD